MSRISLRLLRWFGHRRFLPFGLRDRILRLLVPPDAARDVPFEVTFFGYRYRGNLSNFLDWLIYFYGAYHFGLLMALRDLAAIVGRDRLTFVDIGANAGQMTLFMARYARSVHAFEPVPGLVETIRGKLNDNRIDNVTVHPVALGDCDVERPFYPARGNNLGTDTFIADSAGAANATAISLPIRNGDHYFAAQGIAPVGLIKIDIEGSEFIVISGLVETLARDRPIVVMEWSRATESEFRAQHRTLTNMLPDRYAIFQLLARGDRDYRLARLNGAPTLGDIVLVPEERVAGMSMQGAATR